MRRTASQIIRNLERRIARLEKRSAQSYLLDEDEKKFVQSLKRKLRKVGVENLYHVLIVALHDANFHSEAKAISSYLSVQGDGRDDPAISDAGEFMARKCSWDGDCIARIFAEASKGDFALIYILEKLDLL
tara:strand:- start:517 stop:909 length:393 start_codon:yes stop_codon:yes gene_type:complete